MTAAACGILLGGALGAGICLLVAVMPRWGAPRLERRIAPYIRDVSDPLGLTPVGPIGQRWSWGALARRLEAVTAGSQSVARRLAQAGSDRSVASFRAEQLAWTIGGVVVGATAMVAGLVVGRWSSALAVLPIAAGAAGFVLRDVLLTRAAKARRGRIEEELPLVLEFLALCLSAGEGMLDALARIAQTDAGDLALQLRAVVLEVRMGTPLAQALTAMARTVDLPALIRSCDHVVAAIERGAPLAGVLQSQADDAREDAKRRLIEQAGRKEIAMMIPLVFLILPLSVLFAVFPGVFMLRLGI